MLARFFVRIPERSHIRKVYRIRKFSYLCNGLRLRNRREPDGPLSSVALSSRLKGPSKVTQVVLVCGMNPLLGCLGFLCLFGEGAGPTARWRRGQLVIKQIQAPTHAGDLEHQNEMKDVPDSVPSFEHTPFPFSVYLLPPLPPFITLPTGCHPPSRGAGRNTRTPSTNPVDRPNMVLL